MNDEVRAPIREWLKSLLIGSPVQMTPEEWEEYIEERTEKWSQGDLGQSMLDYYEEHGEYPDLDHGPRAVKLPKSELKTAPEWKMHLFLVVDCRTPGCKTAHALKYLGEKGKIPEGVDVAMPAPFWLRCPNCELNHDYTLSQVRQMERDEPPPSDFRDTI